MSYAVAGALQAAVYQALTTNAALSGLVGAAVYDAVPTGTLPETYVILGTEEVRDRSDGDGTGAEHRMTVSVVSDAAGFATAKAVAVAVSDALVGADLSLTRGRLVYLNFYRAYARREGSTNQRRIDLRFHARVEDS